MSEDQHELRRVDIRNSEHEGVVVIAYNSDGNEIDCIEFSGKECRAIALKLVDFDDQSLAGWDLSDWYDETPHDQEKFTNSVIDGAVGEWLGINGMRMHQDLRNQLADLSIRVSENLSEETR